MQSKIFQKITEYVMYYNRFSNQFPGSLLKNAYVQ